MSKTRTNGTNPNAPKTRKGPKPIVSVAELRTRLLAEMMLRETRKIERRIDRLGRKRSKLQAQIHATDTQLDNLKAMLTEYRAAKA